MIIDSFAGLAVIDLELDATQVQISYIYICQSILSVRQNTQAYKFICPQVFKESFTALALIDLEMDATQL